MSAIALLEHIQGAVIGPDGIAGWDKVQDLAGHLVGLREAPYLTDLQATEAIQLWTALPDTDKQRANYQPQHQPQLTHGHFKAPKRSGVTPGVEMVKQCLIGHPGGPAFHLTQLLWPIRSFLHRGTNWMKCHRHQAQNIHLSFRQIKKDRLQFCDQVDGPLPPPRCAPLHLPPLHQELCNPFQHLGHC